jgi:DNA repair protein RecO
MRTKAIIIKRSAFNEHDQVVTCYCEDTGATRALARGIYRAKSVQSLHLDAFNLVEFEMIPGKLYPIIASAHAIEQYPRLKSDVKRMAMVSFFMEVLDRLMFENQQDEKLWEFLTQLVKRFDSADETELADLFQIQQLKLLEVLGYADAPTHMGMADLNTFFEYMAHGPLHSLRFLNAVLK